MFVSIVFVFIVFTPLLLLLLLFFFLKIIPASTLTALPGAPGLQWRNYLAVPLLVPLPVPRAYLHHCPSHPPWDGLGRSLGGSLESHWEQATSHRKQGTSHRKQTTSIVHSIVHGTVGVSRWIHFLIIFTRAVGERHREPPIAAVSSNLSRTAASKASL